VTDAAFHTYFVVLHSTIYHLRTNTYFPGLRSFVGLNGRSRKMRCAWLPRSTRICCTSGSGDTDLSPGYAINHLHDDAITRLLRRLPDQAAQAMDVPTTMIDAGTLQQQARQRDSPVKKSVPDTGAAVESAHAAGAGPAG
jgi:hypothetical protein